MKSGSPLSDHEGGQWRWRVVVAAGVVLAACLMLYSSRTSETRYASFTATTAGPRPPPGPRPPSMPAFEIPHQKLRVTGVGCDAFKREIGVSGELPPETRLDVVSDSDVVQAPFHLDVLITYVNPFALQANPREGAPSAQRIRDWNELYWCLRSIFRYGQLCISEGRCLLRTIHIFANAADHIPGWLSCRLSSTSATDEEGSFQNFLASKVRVTSHSDVLPKAGLSYNITFNSNVIELMMHRIPDLSPFFLSFNNDMFLGRRLRLQDIFTPVDGGFRSEESCDLVPISFFKSRFARSAKGIQAAVEEADDPDPTTSRRKSKMFYHFKMVNTNLLFKLFSSDAALGGASRRGTRGWLVEEPSRLSVLQYAHTPTLFDIRTLTWLLEHPLISDSVNSTLQKWKARSVDDVWVPFLYINVRYLAKQCSLCPFINAVRNAQNLPKWYKFFEFRSEKTIYRAISQDWGSDWRHPTFVTVNDDFPDEVPATAADPSLALFEERNGVPRRCAKLAECDDVAAQRGKKRAKVTAVAADDGANAAAQAIRYLKLIHQFYCTAFLPQQQNASAAAPPVEMETTPPSR